MNKILLTFLISILWKWNIELLNTSRIIIFWDFLNCVTVHFYWGHITVIIHKPPSSHDWLFNMTIDDELLIHLHTCTHTFNITGWKDSMDLHGNGMTAPKSLRIRPPLKNWLAKLNSTSEIAAIHKVLQWSSSSFFLMRTSFLLFLNKSLINISTSKPNVMKSENAQTVMCKSEIKKVIIMFT